MNTHNFKRIAFRTLAGVLIYAVVWSVVFGVCFLIDKAVGSDATGTILQLVKYAGYPLLAVGWGIAWIMAGILYLMGKILFGLFWVLKWSFPYCLYVIGIPLVFFVLYKVVTHLGSSTGPTQAEREAEARHQERMRAAKEALLLKSLSDMSRH